MSLHRAFPPRLEKLHGSGYNLAVPVSAYGKTSSSVIYRLAPYSPAGPESVSLIWEFAGIERSVNGDIATFLAQLHLHLLVSPISSLAQAALRTLIRSIVGAYRRQCLRRQKDNGTEKVLRMESNTAAVCHLRF